MILEKNIQQEALPPSGLFVAALGYPDIGSFILRPGIVALDFGCGEGRHSRKLAELGVGQVIGLDIDEIQIKLARFYSDKYQNITFQQGEISDLNKTSVNGFDLVISNEVLSSAAEDFRKRRNIIHHLMGLTKPGGVHIISDYLGDASSAALTIGEPWKKGQLRKIYAEKGWLELLHHEERVQEAVVAGRVTHASRAIIAAMKP